MVVPEFKLENQATKGILLGIFSGFTYAILALCNKRFTGKYSGTQISLYEHLFACISLLPFLFVCRPALTLRDIGLLALLGVVFTGIAQSLYVSSLRHVSARMAGIVSCLEPIYSTLFAFLFLHEAPALRDYIGAAIILGAVVYSTLRANKAQAEPLEANA